MGGKKRRHEPEEEEEVNAAPPTLSKKQRNEASTPEYMKTVSLTALSNAELERRITRLDEEARKKRADTNYKSKKAMKDDDKVKEIRQLQQATVDEHTRRGLVMPEPGSSANRCEYTPSTLLQMSSHFAMRLDR